MSRQRDLFRIMLKTCYMICLFGRRYRLVWYGIVPLYRCSSPIQTQTTPEIDFPVSLSQAPNTSLSFVSRSHQRRRVLPFPPPPPPFRTIFNPIDLVTSTFSRHHTSSGARRDCTNEALKSVHGLTDVRLACLYQSSMAAVPRLPPGGEVFPPATRLSARREFYRRAFRERGGLDQRHRNVQSAYRSLMVVTSW